MRLLYIEDDPLNRRVVGDMLQVAGADMIEARDGLSALAAVELLRERGVRPWSRE